MIKTMLLLTGFRESYIKNGELLFFCKRPVIKALSRKMRQQI